MTLLIKPSQTIGFITLPLLCGNYIMQTRKLKDNNNRDILSKKKKNNRDITYHCHV